MKIRTKVLLGIILAVILSIVCVSVMVSFEMRKAFVHNFRIGSEAQLARMEAFVNSFFESAASNVELLASSPLVRRNIENLTSYAHMTKPYTPIGAKLQGDEYELFRELERISKAFPAFSLVYVGGLNGGFIQAPDDTLGPGYNPPDRGWFKDAMRAGKVLITEAYISDNGDAVCTVAAPVKRENGNGFGGVVGFDISLTTLTRETGGVRVGATGYVLILDAVGQVISDPRYSGRDIPEADRWLGKTVDSLPSGAAAAMQGLQKLGRGVADVEFDGKDWLAAVQSTKDGWHLIMLQERAEVFANAMKVTLAILMVGAIAVLAMAAMAWVMARSITGPLDVLGKASQEVAEGDLKAIPSDETLFKGELGVLHRSLRRMVGKLGELIETANSKMAEAEEALALSRQSLSEAEEARLQAERARKEGVMQTVGQISSVIEQLAGTTDRLEHEGCKLARQADSQLDMVTGTAVAIGQMNSVVLEVAGATARTAELADEARGQAGSGKALVFTMVEHMGRIEQQSLEMKKHLENLGIQAGGIGHIINIINDIADQTNLLALNAAIEAARAGDAGRGFAVVADEVRKLAEKTVESTRQVAEAISTIQAGAASSMASMQQAAEFISSSTAVAHKAGEALTGIEAVVDKTAGEVRSIAIASEEQSATTEEINRRTENIKDLTTHVAESAQRGNDVVSELVSLSNRLRRIVEGLSKE